MNPDLDWRPVIFEWNLALKDWTDLCGKYFPDSVELQQEWSELEEDMAPVLDALKCTDYKKKDLDVIDAIPYMIADIWEEIREDMENYLKYARVAFVQMLKDVLPSSDYVIDGTKELEEKVEEIKKIMIKNITLNNNAVNMGIQISL